METQCAHMARKDGVPLGLSSLWRIGDCTVGSLSAGSCVQEKHWRGNLQPCSPQTPSLAHSLEDDLCKAHLQHVYSSLPVASKLAPFYSRNTNG